jgi:transposase
MLRPSFVPPLPIRRLRDLTRYRVDLVAARTAEKSRVEARLDEIPGIGPIAAAAIIAEVGVDMSRFPTAAHVGSWVKFSPWLRSSAGQNQRQCIQRAWQPLRGPHPQRSRGHRRQN